MKPPVIELDVLVAEILDQRARRPRRALAGGAVEDHGLVLVGRDALDPRLEVTLGYVACAGDVAGGPFLVLAHVDHERSGLELLAHGRRIDLFDPVLDLAEDFCSGRDSLSKLLKDARDLPVR